MLEFTSQLGNEHIRKTEKEIRQLETENLDERIAISTNTLWGSDEEALDFWIRENEERL